MTISSICQLGENWEQIKGSILEGREVRMVKQLPLTCPGHSRPVVALQYTDITPDGFFIVSACKDGKPMLRDGVSGDWVGTFLGHKGAVWSAAIDRSGLKAATGSADFSAKIWDSVTGDELFSFDHPHIVRTVALSQRCDMLATGCQDKLLRVFSLISPDSQCINLSGHHSTPRAIVFCNDDLWIVSASEEPCIRVHNIRSGDCMKEIPIAKPAMSLEVSRDGKVITSCGGSFVQFWNAADMCLIKEFELDAEVYSASLNPSCTRFIVGGPDFRVRVFDFATGSEIEFHKAHFGPVHCVRFSPDGDSFASSSEDGTIRIWQTDPKMSAPTTKDEGEPAPSSAVTAE